MSPPGQNRMSYKQVALSRLSILSGPTKHIIVLVPASDLIGSGDDTHMADPFHDIWHDILERLIERVDACLG